MWYMMFVFVWLIPFFLLNFISFQSSYSFLFILHYVDYFFTRNKYPKGYEKMPIALAI